MSDEIKNNETSNDFEEFEEFDGNLIEDDEFPEVMEENFNDEVNFSDDDENIDNFEEFDEIDYSKPTPQKNGVNWFNIGIIGAVIIGIAGATYSFLPSIMGGENISPKNRPAIAVKTAEENKKIATTIVSSGTTDNNEVGFFNNPDLLNNNSKQSDANETSTEDNIFNPIENPAPSISDTEIDDLFAVIPEIETNIPSAPQDNLDPIETQVIDTLPMPADAQPMVIDQIDELPVIEQPKLTQQPVVNDNISNNDEIERINSRIDTMNTQMESFMNRLDAKLENMSGPTQQTVGTDSLGQLNQLQKTLSRLENRIDAMESKSKVMVAPTPAPVVTITETPKPKIIIEEKAPDVLLPTPEPTKTVTRPKRREPAYVPPKMTYELRGASNGQAVIAQRGTQNLQTVNVGSVVRGLGTIRSIALENGQWVIRGTSGTVRQ